MNAKPTPPAALPLADSLAQMRTLLAIERTLLAYVRTALAIFISGVGLIQFFEEPAFKWSGLALLPLGLLTFLIGVLRYFRLREKILKGYPQFSQSREAGLENEE